MNPLLSIENNIWAEHIQRATITPHSMVRVLRVSCWADIHTAHSSRHTQVCVISIVCRSRCLIRCVTWPMITYVYIIKTSNHYIYTVIEVVTTDFAIFGYPSCVLPPTEEFPWDDFRTILHDCHWMARLQNGVEILPKILTG